MLSCNSSYNLLIEIRIRYKSERRSLHDFQIKGEKKREIIALPEICGDI